jgi:diaminohydroxyphosphoribosylaminopyrimidine deaminase / 5-amino-6-(5-phosphoribosylamino)uracil reductase
MEKYISRCIQLAKNGLGSTFPNPMVGCVIVHNDSIIGEGFTSPYGGTHAEVNAINSVKDKALLSKSVLYVTLEPCSHYGKTPPCSDLIIRSKIPHVVIGTSDSNSKVAGRGIQKLKDAGCNVTLGLLQKECQEHHKRFLTFHQKKRPYIILKWAETLDGFIAPGKEKRNEKVQPYWITNKYSRQMVHKWRSEEQAILVGTNTVLEDNPKLNVRTWNGKSPTRIILDKDLKVKGDYHIFDQYIKTIIITQQNNMRFQEEGIDYEIIDFSKNVGQQVCEVLQKQDIISVLIEGGSKTIQTFIDANLWDEARVFMGSVAFGSGLKAPRLSSKAAHLKQIESDTLTIYSND